MKKTANLLQVSFFSNIVNFVSIRMYQVDTIFKTETNGEGGSVLGDSKCLVWQLTFFRLVSASLCTQISSTCIYCMSMVRKVTDDM